MAGDEHDRRDHALVLAHDAAPVAGDRPAAPSAPVQAAVGAMLQGAVAGFGDVVQALLCDLDTATVGLQGLTWLWSSQGALDQEQAYQAAVQQLQWWDSFLGELPCPELISERRRLELRKLKGLRARARIQAREAALADHRRLLEAEVADVEVDPDQATALMEIHQDPGPGQWRVDIAAYEAQALAALPELEEPTPIIAADLDAAHSFAGFHAVDAMRRHPLLAGRAAHLDQAVAAALREHLDLDRKAAAAHAHALTGIFWIALRRALETGSNQLAISIRLLSGAGEHGVQEQFTRELLTSWLAYLDQIPDSDRQRSGRLRLPLLGKRTEQGGHPALAAAAPKQLTDGRAQGGASWWSRVKRGLGLEAGAAPAGQDARGGSGPDGGGSDD